MQEVIFPPIRIDDGDRYSAIEKILDERYRQLALPVTSLDSSNSDNDWVAYAVTYLGRATSAARNQREAQDVDVNLIKAAATILAALEARAKKGTS